MCIDLTVAHIEGDYGNIEDIKSYTVDALLPLALCDDTSVRTPPYITYKKRFRSTITSLHRCHHNIIIMQV